MNVKMHKYQQINVDMLKVLYWDPTVSQENLSWHF